MAEPWWPSWTDFRPAYDTVALNDRLRIDVLADSSEDWGDVTVVLRWGWVT